MVMEVMAGMVMEVMVVVRILKTKAASVKVRKGLTMQTMPVTGNIQDARNIIVLQISKVEMLFKLTCPR